MTKTRGSADLTQRIVETATGLGFARIGVVSTREPTRYREYLRWLDEGFHGEMEYMGHPDRIRARASLHDMLDGTQSVVTAAAPYDHRQPSGAEGRGVVARYAHGPDYHRVVKNALSAVAELIHDATGAETRACVDTAPILERDLAERAGLGFIGKNTMLISPGVGSYTFLGQVLTTAELEPTEHPLIGDRCGECTACLDACPTQAFVSPYVLDARRCLSYLTIEHRGPIDPELREAMGSRVYGCDICQEVCPYNSQAPARQTPMSGLHEDESPRREPTLAALAALSTGDYRRLTRGSAMNRARRNMLRRNGIIAAGNEGQTSPELVAALDDADPMVRAAAAWALGRCKAVAVLEARREIETEPLVLEEISAAISRASDVARER